MEGSAKMRDFDYSGPTSQEPKPVSPDVYDEPKVERPAFYRIPIMCEFCDRKAIGYTVGGGPTTFYASSYVHAPGTNGQPDICKPS